MMSDAETPSSQPEKKIKIGSREGAYGFERLTCDLIEHTGSMANNLKQARFCVKNLLAVELFFLMGLITVSKRYMGNNSLSGTFVVFLIGFLGWPILATMFTSSWLSGAFLSHLKKETGRTVPDPDVSNQDPFEEFPKNTVSVAMQRNKLKALKEALRRHWDYHERESRRDGSVLVETDDPGYRGAFIRGVWGALAGIIAGLLLTTRLSAGFMGSGLPWLFFWGFIVLLWGSVGIAFINNRIKR